MPAPAAVMSVVLPCSRPAMSFSLAKIHAWHHSELVPGTHFLQYVDRPPVMSSTAPVVNEQSSDDSHATSAAISCTSRKRPIGIFASMYCLCSSVPCARISVSATAGVMQLHSTPVFASSLPSDFVRPMTPAFAALYAGALGLP